MLPPFPEGTITSFAPTSPHFFLSNFYSHSVTYEDITYPTSEHAFQAAKSLDENVRLDMMRLGTAYQAKKRGHEIIKREDWERVKLQVMYDILKVKFKPGSPLEQRLWQTADAHIVEGNHWHDRIWGQCNCSKHNWDGTNYLGRLLMKVRNEVDGFQTWNKVKEQVHSFPF